MERRFFSLWFGAHLSVIMKSNKKSTTKGVAIYFFLNILQFKKIFYYSDKGISKDEGGVEETRRTQ